MALKQTFKVRGASLASLPAFLAVAARKSFTAAAVDLGVSPSAISQAVQRLERRVGAALVVRTTRSVNLTDLGAKLAEEAGPSVSAAVAAVEAVATGRDEPTGVLRLNVPRLACRVAMPPLVAAYLRAHPTMRVEITVEDRNVDIVKEGFDAGVRLRESVERDMVTVRVSDPIRFLVVGSRRYLDARGRPKKPADLVEHACILWRSPTTGAVYRWEFEHRGRELEVGVDGPVATSDADVLVACAREGLGLTYVAEHELGDALATGALENVLDDYCPEVPGLFLYYPRASRRVAKLAAFVECARRLTGPARRATARPRET